MKSELTTYKDRKGDWRWRVKASNGKKIACASEGYKSKRALRRSMELTYDALQEWLGD